MRNRIAAIGVVIAVTTGLAGAAAVTFGIASPAPSAPQAAAPASSTGTAAAAVAADPAYPTVMDHCYIEGMIPHHEQALELSRLVLDADGVRERTRALAEFILADQAAEIDTMRGWQDAWRRAIPVEAISAGTGTVAGGHGSGHGATGDIATGCGDHTEHARMSGMATPAQLAALDAAEGAAADRMFLELMIVHHEGALEMAKDAVLEGSNAFVRSSAKHVLVEQEREVAAMTALIDELP